MFDERSYNLVIKVAEKLQQMKGFETAYSNPKKGVLIINLDGQNFLIEASPILEQDVPLMDAVNKYKYMFK